MVGREDAVLRIIRIRHGARFTKPAASKSNEGSTMVSTGRPAFFATTPRSHQRAKHGGIIHELTNQMRYKEAEKRGEKEENMPEFLHGPRRRKVISVLQQSSFSENRKQKTYIYIRGKKVRKEDVVVVVFAMAIVQKAWYTGKRRKKKI